MINRGKPIFGAGAVFRDTAIHQPKPVQVLAKRHSHFVRQFANFW